MIYILKAKWNESVTEALAKGAESHLIKSGFHCRIIEVPGALEIPLTLQYLWQKSPADFQGAVACGCVIKGDTQHFDIVANESARGIQDVSLKIGRPITNAILAVYRSEDALERSRPGNNKGEEAAEALVHILRLIKQEEIPL